MDAYITAALDCGPNGWLEFDKLISFSFDRSKKYVFMPSCDGVYARTSGYGTGGVKIIGLTQDRENIFLHNMSTGIKTLVAEGKLMYVCFTIGGVNYSLRFYPTKVDWMKEVSNMGKKGEEVGNPLIITWSIEGVCDSANALLMSVQNSALGTINEPPKKQKGFGPSSPVHICHMKLHQWRRQ